MNKRILAVALFASFLALANAAPAAAHTNFSVAIGIPGIPFFGAVAVPGPYYAPPVYAPVYAPAPLYVPAPVYGGPVFYGHFYGPPRVYGHAYRPYHVRGYYGHGYRRW